MNKIVYLLPLALAASGCTHRNVTKEGSSDIAGAPSAAVQAHPSAIGYRGGEGSARYMPKATAMRLSGDYADNVAVTLDADGRLVSFPAPSDITAASRPTDLGGGWWLNNQGIGANSVFTRYTFAQYAALDNVPTPGQLLDSIIPGARVLKMVTLPFAASEAASHIDEIKEYLENEQ